MKMSPERPTDGSGALPGIGRGRGLELGRRAFSLESLLRWLDKLLTEKPPPPTGRLARLKKRALRLLRKARTLSDKRYFKKAKWGRS